MNGDYKKLLEPIIGWAERPIRPWNLGGQKVGGKKMAINKESMMRIIARVKKYFKDLIEGLKYLQELRAQGKMMKKAEKHLYS
ncbi:MAG: hypothetical protein ACD_50C00389G0001 [uncultured bacterium]|nr:MAG: hypothetical protein ACD_50C00389G0001 [uncultured bacterium]